MSARRTSPLWYGVYLAILARYLYLLLYEPSSSLFTTVFHWLVVAAALGGMAVVVKQRRGSGGSGGGLPGDGAPPSKDGAPDGGDQTSTSREDGGAASRGSSLSGAGGTTEGAERRVTVGETDAGAAGPPLEAERAEELVPARAVDFDLSLDVYDEVAAWLEEQGFRRLGDVEDQRSSREMPDLRTFCRLHVSADHRILACFSLLRPTGSLTAFLQVGLVEGEREILELITPLGGGAMVVTSNGAEATPVHPLLFHQRYSPETSAEELLESHVQWLEAQPPFEPGLRTDQEALLAFLAYLELKRYIVPPGAEEQSLRQEVGRELTALELRITRELDRLKRLGRESGFEV